MLNKKEVAVVLSTLPTTEPAAALSLFFFLFLLL